MTQALDLAFNEAVRTMARKVWPLGYDISDDPIYAVPPAPEIYFGNVGRAGRVTIYTGGSDHTIFGDPEFNYDFRAWHEWAHFVLRAPFTLDDELRVAHRQCEDLALIYGHGVQTLRWQRLIMAEVYGQALYFKKWGEFPTDQADFDLAFMHASEYTYPRNALAAR